MEHNRKMAFTSPFHYKNGRLYAEDVPVEAVTREASTPTYIYSQNAILARLNAYQRAFRSVPHLICYSVKANSNLSILRLLSKHGAGADIVSKGELERTLRSGFAPGKIIFSGVGKTEEEIRLALRRGIRMLNVESEEELLKIREVAKRLRVRAPISIRVNPDIKADTHHHIQTGSKAHKFGIDPAQALRLYRRARRCPEIITIGIQCHIGSQITQVEPYRKAFETLLALKERLMKEGIPIDIIDIGGGLGVAYRNEQSPHPEALAQMILPKLRESTAILFLEPGRSLVAEPGILVTRVIYRKNSHGKRFVIVDAGMNDMARPSLYDAYHTIQPVRKTLNGRPVKADIVGPICESGDYLARGRVLRLPGQGNLLAVMTTGAYGFSMSSQYNSRPRAAEVLVEGNRWRFIRRREKTEDLWREEIDFVKK